jgi:hypothetical protein
MGTAQIKTAPRAFPGAVAGKCRLALTPQPLQPRDRPGQPRAARAGLGTRLVSASAMSS